MKLNLQLRNVDSLTNNITGLIEFTLSQHPGV